VGSARFYKHMEVDMDTYERVIRWRLNIKAKRANIASKKTITHTVEMILKCPKTKHKHLVTPGFTQQLHSIQVQSSPQPSL
jgi:hypothetical protein